MGDCLAVWAAGGEHGQVGGQGVLRACSEGSSATVDGVINELLAITPLMTRAVMNVSTDLVEEIDRLFRRGRIIRFMHGFINQFLQREQRKTNMFNFVYLITDVRVECYD